MKKIIFSTIGIIAFTLFSSDIISAQVMMGNTITNSDDHTAREETEGKIVWEKLQAKQVQCLDLSDDDFGVLGEYFMGQMMGTSHEAMNNMMIQMMGEKGEEQMHIVMGKRLSGCDTSAAFPSQGIGFMPMMQMMMGTNMMGTNFSGNWGMMPWGNMMGTSGFWFWLFPLGIIIWLIVGILAAVWLWKQVSKK